VKTLPPVDDNARFSGHIRHYHRSGAKPRKSWDEWIDGKSADSNARWDGLKISGSIVALLVLAAIAIGLLIKFQ